MLPASLKTKSRKGPSSSISTLEPYYWKTDVARDLAAGEITNDLEGVQDDVDVPDDVEQILEELFEALQDKVYFILFPQ